MKTLMTLIALAVAALMLTGCIVINREVGTHRCPCPHCTGDACPAECCQQTN